MSFAHPALTLLGKKKGKKKFASAEAKRKAMELEAEWQALKNKHKGKQVKQSTSWSYSLSAPPGRETVKHQSRGDGLGNATLKQTQQYTGDKMIGISIIHKSCLQPIFNEEAAKDAANMRR